MNVSIVSTRMSNIDKETVTLQRQVVAARNPKGYNHLDVMTNASHAETMDWIMANQSSKYDVVIFLDVDAIPLTDSALEYLAETANSGILVGDAQSSNHINGGKHVFVAPSCLALTPKLYDKIGRPSAVPNHRGDVAEEWTWRAQEEGIFTQFLFPLSYELPVRRMSWETDKSAAWKLQGTGAEYGIGTRFGLDSKEALIYHHFQIFHEGHQKHFQDVCRAELIKINGGTPTGE